MTSDEKDFDIGTQRLIRLAGGFSIASAGQNTFPHIVEKLRTLFKSDDVYRFVMGEERKIGFDYGRNFCLVASYYIMKNTGGDAVWSLFTGPIHWWLVHKSTGNIFDITYDQFPRYRYSIGKPETRIPEASIFTAKVQRQLALLSKCVEQDKHVKDAVPVKPNVSHLVSVTR